ncbi:MAG: excinuclease ABC subunit UvrC [Gammaproteobacteria bacterium]
MSEGLEHNELLDGFPVEPGRFDPAEFLTRLTKRPGIYRMVDAEDTVIYVGKARNLRSRVSSYFRSNLQTRKTELMMRRVVRVDITVTNTEAEALILEDTLIKSLKPRYNVLLRDDKTYPFIRVSTNKEFPRVSFYRGKSRGAGKFFGPYPSSLAVREAVQLLQKLFRLRSCDDTFFSHRSRPCLQHQIKRCSAPCVGLIEAEKYQSDIQHALYFLEGKSEKVTEDIKRRMMESSEEQDYESAAHYRDQLASLKQIQERQLAVGSAGIDMDVVAAVSDGTTHCVTVIFIRAGRNLGTRSYFPRVVAEAEMTEVLSAFVAQYYLSRGAPPEIVINVELPDADWIANALSEKIERTVRIRHRVRQDRAGWLKLAVTNAEHALALRQASSAQVLEQLEELRVLLDLTDTPQRIECFDISHTAGDSTSASCVVFDREAMRNAEYRRFNIKGISPGDDYGAMSQALKRRYTRVKKGEAPLPDILLIDGGIGQVKAAADILEELQISEPLILGIAKGSERRSGHERLFIHGRLGWITPGRNSTALRLLMQVRDEAHRFAVRSHRSRRDKKATTSVLEHIPGLGAKRRRLLLRHFGGLQGVQRAGVEDLKKVEGIGPKLAKTIYTQIHEA